jgi:hypothetical protein
MQICHDYSSEHFIYFPVRDHDFEAHERRKDQGPDVRRVAFPYSGFGKVITGPMESRLAEE